ncbi:MAG: hypothetical protein C4583_19050 [Anaerolineaceae bacterium]|nr:MAG: hypothetical protein C4583_19050 [Anaerolineaceae bacterium]
MPSLIDIDKLSKGMKGKNHRSSKGSKSDKKIDIYRKRFDKYKLKYTTFVVQKDKEKVIDQIKALLNLVEDLGQPGKQLKNEIETFLRDQGVKMKEDGVGASDSGYPSLAKLIEDRESKIVISQHPARVIGPLGKHGPALEKTAKLLSKIKR